MASRKAFSGTLIVLVVFALIWLVAVGLLYVQWEASPVREMSVRDGVVLGEMGFVEARAWAVASFTIPWVVLLAASLGKWGGGGKRTASNPQSGGQPTSGMMAAGWYPDAATRHELRYWNGAGWTEHVSDAGVAGVDSLDA